MKKTLFLILFLCSITNVFSQINTLNTSNKAAPRNVTVDKANSKTLLLSDDPIESTMEKEYYRTTEFYQIEGKKVEILELDKIVKTQENDLISIRNAKPLDTAKYSAKIKELQKSKNSISELNHKIDTLYNLYLGDVINYRRVHVFFNALKAKQIFEKLYSDSGNTFSAIKNAGINIGNNTTSLYSELLTGSLGAVRMSIGSMVSNNINKDSAKGSFEESYQKLISYGGNTVFTLEYPLAYIHSRNYSFNFISRFLLRGAADIPTFGKYTDEFAGNIAGSIDFYTDLSTRNKDIKLFFNFNGQLIYGTKEFTKKLNITKNFFGMSQMGLGIVLAQKLKISILLPTFSSLKELSKTGIIAGGGQIIN